MRIRTAILSCLGLLIASCGGGNDGPAPFTLQINSQDVILNAVHRVEIVIEPRDLDRRFAMMPDRSVANGQITTSVSSAGEYVIRIEREWIVDRADSSSSSAVFIVDVPLQPSSGPDDSSVSDPTATVTFIRGTERIARSQRLLPWPLPPGGEAVVTVQCIRPEFSLQCTNNDPFPTSDAGVEPDAGAAPDAGTGADGG